MALEPFVPIFFNNPFSSSTLMSLLAVALDTLAISWYLELVMSPYHYHQFRWTVFLRLHWQNRRSISGIRLSRIFCILCFDFPPLWILFLVFKAFATDKAFYIGIKFFSHAIFNERVLIHIAVILLPDNSTLTHNAYFAYNFMNFLDALQFLVIFMQIQ